MEYLRGWRALRQDPQWLGKVGIGTLLMLVIGCVPLVGIAAQLVLIGWSGLMLRRAVSGQESPLPRLDFDFGYLGKLLQGGFKPFLARMIWSLPVMILAGAMGVCMYAGVIMMALQARDGGGGPGVGAGMACMMGGGFLAFYVLLIALSLPVQIATLRVELTDDLNAAMRFKEVLAMTRFMLKELIVGNIVIYLISMVVVAIGIFSLYLLLFPGVIVLQVIMTYWYAELYRVYLEKGGQPLAIGPLDVEEPPRPPAPQQPAF